MLLLGKAYDTKQAKHVLGHVVAQNFWPKKIIFLHDNQLATLVNWHAAPKQMSTSGRSRRKL